MNSPSDPNRPPASSGAPGEHPDTLAVHGGGFHDPATGAVTPPIEMSTVFAFPGVAEMAATFRGEREAYIYTRYGNPTLDLVERHVAALEGAEAGLATASGMAAISTALLTLLSAGDHLVAAADLYGGSRNLFGLLSRMGVAVDYFPVEEMGAVSRLIRPETKAVFVETPTNPTLKILDLAEVARLSRARGVPVVVDNTFATPLGQQPLALGCDLVVHSATKALAGHDDVTAGFVVGSRARIDAARDVMKWMGGCLDPHAAWLIERGLKTLGLRVARQSENALKVATWLARQPQVSRVHYPGLPEHPGHDVARRQMRHFGGLLAFELKGGAGAVERFVGQVRLIRLAPSLGGVETIALVPSVSSHIRMTPEERQAVGIPDGMIRISCGVEDGNDLVADLARGFQ